MTNEVAMDNQAIIEVRDVYKHFKTPRGTLTALRDVSLDVQMGEVIVVIGPSGGGKSTLLRCLNRLESFDKGSIVVDGIPLDTAVNINRVRAEIGMVFQSFNLFPDRTALDDICLAQRVVRKRSRKGAEQVARALLIKVGIAEKADAYQGQLCGGQLQLVAIARSLALNP